MRPRKDVESTTGEPHDRLTRLANEVLETLEEHPEYEPGVRAIAFINHNDRAGIGLHGYDDEKDAIIDLVVHLQALFAALGKELILTPIQQSDPRLS